MAFSHNFGESDLELISEKSVAVFDALDTQDGFFSECDISAVGSVLAVMIEVYCKEYPDQKPVIGDWLRKEFLQTCEAEIY